MFRKSRNKGKKSPKDLQSSPKDDETYEVQNVNKNSSGYEKLDMNPKENLKENSTKVVKVIKVPIPGGGDLEKELHLDSLLADIAADILEVRRLSRELQEDEQAARYEHQGVDLNSNTTQDSRDPQFLHQESVIDAQRSLLWHC